MTIPNPSADRRSWRHAWRPLPILAALAALAGCAAPARIEVPAELPLRTTDQVFEIRWALQRETARARAVGHVSLSFDTEAQLTLAFFGVDAERRIVSRGTTYLRSEFSREPIPFSVELTPTGRETGFELRVIEYHLPGLRGRN
jgi:hypothetical protein